MHLATEDNGSSTWTPAIYMKHLDGVPVPVSGLTQPQLLQTFCRVKEQMEDDLFVCVSPTLSNKFFKKKKVKYFLNVCTFGDSISLFYYIFADRGLEHSHYWITLQMTIMTKHRVMSGKQLLKLSLLPPRTCLEGKRK